MVQSKMPGQAISVDAMGGDHAPEEIVKGAIAAARDAGINIVLFGTSAVAQEVARLNTSSLPVRVVVTEEYVQEGEAPAMALRRKPKASIFLATRMVRTGEASAMVSAGPTGSVMTAAVAILGLLDGIERPVIGGPFVGFAPKTTIMDVGANVDVNAYHLLSFAVIGSAYARRFMDVENPSVAILSVGSEEGKGNNLVKEAWPMFKESGLNFIGNAEGHDLVSGKANVIVCDGFVGNVVLKFCEGMGYALNAYLKKGLRGQLPEERIEALTRDLMALTNRADVAGGGPILGVNGVAIKAHGRSKAEDITRSILQARNIVQSNFIDELKSDLARVKSITKPSTSTNI
jgi:glycerol-3-phosphate acyltransferase PlsX